jgi:hypothetical protein
MNLAKFLAMMQDLDKTAKNCIIKINLFNMQNLIKMHKRVTDGTQKIFGAQEKSLGNNGSTEMFHDDIKSIRTVLQLIIKRLMLHRAF